MPGPLQKDNILYHYFQKPREIKRALIFSGEAIEAERIEQYTHRVIKKPSFSFAVSDGFDLETKQHILNGFQLDSFDLFFGQLSDLDYVAHLSGGAWVLDEAVYQTAEIVKSVIKRMTNDTVLLVYGSNQARENGQHMDEGESVLFAFSKLGFPMKAKHPGAEKIPVRLEDLAAISSSILDVKIPFSNLGFVHPWFVLDETSNTTLGKHTENLE